MYCSGSDTGFYDKCSAVRALRVYWRPGFSSHRTENNVTLRPLKRRYHSDMDFSVYISCSTYHRKNFRKLKKIVKHSNVHIWHVCKIFSHGDIRYYPFEWISLSLSLSLYLSIIVIFSIFFVPREMTSIVSFKRPNCVGKLRKSCDKKSISRVRSSTTWRSTCDEPSRSCRILPTSAKFVTPYRKLKHLYEPIIVYYRYILLV